MIFVDGTDEILYSEDGCTQGDPIAMLLYSVGVKPLFVVVKEKVAKVFNDKGEKLFQVLFAAIRVRALVEEGPKYGYYPEPSKSVLVVKESKEERAREVFAEYPDLEIVSHHRFLGRLHWRKCQGGGLREEEGRHLHRWTVEKFPQSAYVAFATLLQSEWKFLQRLTPCLLCWPAAEAQGRG